MSESSKIINNLGELPTIVKGAGVNFAGTLVNKILSFAFILFIARLITTKEMGLYYQGMMVAQVLFTFSTLGLDAGVLRFVSIYRGQGAADRVKGTVLSALAVAGPVSIISGILIYLFSDLISLHFFHDPSFESVLKLFSLTIPFLVIGNIFIAVTHGFKLMQYKMFCESGELVARFLLSFLLLFILGLGFNGVILSCVVSILFSACLAYYFTSKLLSKYEKKIGPVFEFRQLITFSVPQSFSELFIILTVSIDTLMIGYFRTSDEVGVYNIAMGMAIFGLIISESFRIIFAPIIADLHNRKDVVQLNDLFKLVTRWIFTISLIPFLFFILFPVPILSIFGKDFTAGSTCLIIISIGFLVSSAVGPANYMVLMSGRSFISFLNHLVALILNIALNYILIPKYGITGVAISKAISIAALDIIRLIETFYFLKIHPYNISYWKPLLAGTISTIIIYFSNGMFTNTAGTVIGMTTFLLSYIFIILTLKLNSEDLYVLKLIFNKLSLLTNQRPST